MKKTDEQSKAEKPETEDKPEENNVVDLKKKEGDEQPGKPPKQANQYRLTENEILKFKNLNLQKQLANKDLESAGLQEELVAKLVSARVGEDVSRWKFDLQRGIVSRLPSNQAPPDPNAKTPEGQA